MDAVRPSTTPRRARRAVSAISAVALVLSGLLTAAAVPAVAAPAPAAPCASGVLAGPGSVGRIHGIARPRTAVGACPPASARTAAAAGATPGTVSIGSGGNPPLINHGGPVMGTQSTGDQVVVTPIYWENPGFTFTSAYKSTINQYLADLAADSGKTTNVFATTFQYAGSNGAINYRMSVGTPITDTTTYPTAGCPIDGGAIYADQVTGYATCLSDDQVVAETNAVLTAHALTRDLGHMYVVFLPRRVETCYNAGTVATPTWQCSINGTASSAFCAYHSAFDTLAGHAVYANMPFPVYTSPTGASCTSQGLGGGIQAPNGVVDADVEISPLSHEMAEAITDPDGNAWFDSVGYENGDDCAYVYGNLGGTDGAHYNQTINGHHYLTQEEFSNADWSGLTGPTEPCLQTIAPVTPTVSTVSPSSGPTAGGTSVTITGTGFPGTSAVHVGSAAATFTILDSTHLAVTAPAGTAGTTDITVTTAAGTSSVVASDHFTYAAAAPTVTGVSPAVGSPLGGTLITITGTDLTGATAVHVGASAASFTVDSATQITATSPGGSPGTVDVTVTTPSGTSPTSAADHFTYTSGPAVTAVSPSAGPSAGGASLSVTGTNFTGASAVTVGGVAATSFTVADATHLTVTTPAHAAGTVDVVVTGPGGTSPTVAADHYTYVDAPTVSTVSPASGAVTGGATVTITGTGLDAAGISVAFGGTTASFSHMDSTHLTATVPAHAAGTVDVVVTSPGGSSATSPGDQYTYLALPSVTGVSPASGPVAGGGTVTITGSGFATTSAVTFDGAAGFFTVVDDAHLSVTVPSQAAGPVHVVVTTDAGTSTISGADAYTFVAVPTVSKISPSSVPLAGATITITGSNFTPGTTVTVAGHPATSVVVVSSTRITARVPAHAAGVVDVRVATVGGTSPVTAADRVTYVVRPVVTSVSPASGTRRGGLRVTVRGSGFVLGSVVKFGTTAGRVVSIRGTVIVVVTPRHVAGRVAVSVVTPGGTSAAKATARYLFL